MKSALETAIKKYRPSRVAITAPFLPGMGCRKKSVDLYYRLDLTSLRVPSKTKNMVHRAGRELTIDEGTGFGRDHQALIDLFLGSRELEEGTRVIFSRIADYLSSVPAARVFAARDSRGTLAGFDVADFGAGEYAFYLFNFRSPEAAVPGTSDLLLHALIREAQERGKRYLNLGLGINEGVAFFKKKWGGRPFLPHQSLVYRPSPPSIFDLLRKGLTQVC
jgi:hypothetical protein